MNLLLVEVSMLLGRSPVGTGEDLSHNFEPISASLWPKCEVEGKDRAAQEHKYENDSIVQGLENSLGRPRISPPAPLTNLSRVKQFQQEGLREPGIRIFPSSGVTALT